MCDLIRGKAKQKPCVSLDVALSARFEPACYACGVFGLSVPELLVLAFVGIFARWSYIGPPSPSWVRFHPIDGLMTALIGAPVAVLGWYVESWGMFAVGATLAVAGLSGSVRMMTTARLRKTQKH